ncbi:hypothetical protein Pmani_025414 [Petrolisthes manimaculis]|uniref:Cryptochrome DASH n=1 Tax=Petrolisthes manimaculis TaxID=1843537 RepID=A0AAE1TYF5_9EUCA|nr:hypothetical protein Pmani_025414 [Petrolisthes manimaculis]
MFLRGGYTCSGVVRPGNKRGLPHLTHLISPKKAKESVIMMEAKKESVALCWLRNDLRYHDNEILLKAHQEADTVLPVYCFDPRHYQGTYHHCFPKTGQHRGCFILKSVQNLRHTLQAKGSELVMRWGQPEQVIPELLSSLHSSQPSTHFSVFYQTEVTKEEKDVETGVREGCKAFKATVHPVWGATLYHRDDLPFTINRLPDTYTGFRKEVEGRGRIRPPLTMPDKLKPLPPDCLPGDLPSMAQLGLSDMSVDKRTAFPFSGGESEGMKRVEQYFWGTDSVAKYKETRNGLLGEKYSTKFSSWLSLGCLSPRYVYSELKKYERERTANQSTYWVIFEMIWRDYFKFVCLKYGDRVFYPSGIKGKKIQWSYNSKLFNAWKEGTTGVPFVDANMREMRETGWMSNRGRQNVASFLIKDLKQDWRLGAEWFESQLLDHDVCSNYGNWNYAAGIGNDPREDRKFNMVKQAMDYDSQGDFVRTWVPELKGISGGAIHTPWSLSFSTLDQAGVSLGEDYPNPIVVAPEWSRHTHKAGPANNSRGNGGKWNSGQKPRQKGMDFYFKSQKK